MNSQKKYLNKIFCLHKISVMNLKIPEIYRKLLNFLKDKERI